MGIRYGKRLYSPAVYGVCGIMDTDCYCTIDSPASGIYKEKGSRFLSFALPVLTEEDIKEYLQQFRKEYDDARHVCYGYSLGVEKPIRKGSDDGEPAHTAGTPIINQIRSFQLTNILVIVVRYFGGIKLGTGGLTEAYKEAAKDCLNKSVSVEKYLSAVLELRFQPSVQGEIMRLVKDHQGSIRALEYESEVILTVDIRKSLVAAFSAKKIHGLSITIPSPENH